MQVEKISTFLKQPLTLDKIPFAKRPLNVRLSPAGFGFITMTACGFLMSANFSNNLIFAMTFLLAGIALVGWYQTRINLTGLKFGQWRSKPIFAGQNIIYTLPVRNPGTTPGLGVRAISRNCVNIRQKSIAAQDRTLLQIECPAPERGLVPETEAWLLSQFPLGIFTARLRTGILPESLVYPTPKGNQPLPEQPSGQQAHQLRESGTFTDMRRYTPGDPPGRIAWQALARTDELYSKEFDGAQGNPALWLHWDDVKVSGVEEKLSQLCRWVIDAARQQKEYGLILPGVKIMPAREESHYRLCLRALALYGKNEKDI